MTRERVLVIVGLSLGAGALMFALTGDAVIGFFTVLSVLWLAVCIRWGLVGF